MSTWVEIAGRTVEAVGVAILVVGVFGAFATALVRLRRGMGTDAVYRQTRGNLGRVLLLGLEVLVAGDIIATVAVEPSLRSVAVLGAIVVIRTFLSWSIEMETEGRLPWRRGAAPQGATAGRAGPSGGEVPAAPPPA